MNVGIGTWPARRAAIQPNDVAIEFEGATVTYRAFAERVTKLANALRAAGVERGDRVAVMSFNHPAVLEYFFAVGLVGGICVLMNPRLTVPELEYILGDCSPKVVAHGTQLADAASELATRIDDIRWVGIEGGGPGEEHEAFLASGSDEFPDVEVDADDVALIMYTSGTTGNPKGAMLTHSNLFHQYMQALIGQDLRQDDIHLVAAPLFHVAGLNTIAIPTFTLGGRLIIMRAVQPEEMLGIIARDRVTTTSLVPSILDMMAQSPAFPDADLSTLRVVQVGGSSMSEKTLRTFLDRGIRVSQGFGMTETSPGVTLLESRDGLEKLGSVGRQHFFVEYRLVDLNGDDVPDGQPGEILARGPAVMKGYWNNPRATERVLEDGWYHSGDIGVRDADGFLYIRDRLKDMYISGGENVYPAEVENALRNVPGVKDAAVIGVPDEKWGETGRAFVVLDDPDADVEALRPLLRERLAGYKMPRDIVALADLPRTATGKVRKHDLQTLP